MSIEISNRTPIRFSRRDVLKSAGAATIASQIPDMKRKDLEITPFPVDKVGWNINMVGLRNNPQEVISHILKLPGGSVRISIPMDEVWVEKTAPFHFEKTDRVINRVLLAGKKIDLQMGMKTIGWPEVHAPIWLVEQFPYLKQDGIQLDQDDEVRKYIFEYLSKVSSRYLTIKEIRTIQVENEPFSKRLSVSRYRYLSPQFNKEEREVVAAHDPYHRPFLQNAPLDSPDNFVALYALNDVDIIGINSYPQHKERYLNLVPQGVFEFGLWKYIEGIVNASRMFGKRIKITEYQIAPWNNEPFNFSTMVRGLKEIQRIDPEFGVAFWDAEKVYAKGKKDEIAFLEQIAA